MNATIELRIQVIAMLGFHSLLITVIRRCGCFQLHMKIQSKVLCCKIIVPSHWILWWRLGCMPSGLKTTKRNRIWHTAWSRWEGLRWSGGGQDWILQRETAHLDTEVEYTPCWCAMDWKSISKTEDPCWKIHWAWFFRRMEGSSVPTSMFLNSFGRHRGLQQWVSTTVRLMATRYFAGFCNFLIGKLKISTNACQWTSTESQIRRRRSNAQSTPVRTWKYKMPLALCTSPWISCAELSSCWPSPSFEVVAHEVFTNYFDIFSVYAEIGNDDCAEMQLKFQDSPNPSLFISTPNVGGSHLILTVPNHAVITHMLWKLDEQHPALTWAVRLGQNTARHSWLWNSGPTGWHNSMIDLHELLGVAHMRLLHCLESPPNITTLGVYQVVEYCVDYKKRHLEQSNIMQSDG